MKKRTKRHKKTHTLKHHHKQSFPPSCPPQAWFSVSPVKLNTISIVGFFWKALTCELGCLNIDQRHVRANDHFWNNIIHHMVPFRIGSSWQAVVKRTEGEAALWKSCVRVCLNKADNDKCKKSHIPFVQDWSAVQYHGLYSYLLIATFAFLFFVSVIASKNLCQNGNAWRCL